MRAVRSGDSLVLDSGLVVRLAGVEAPRRGAPMADEARAALEKLALGRQAELRYGGLRRLRDESAIAHVFVRTEGGRRLWAQGEMLRQGMARVHTRKDNPARADKMLMLEAQARGAKRGLWSDAAYAVLRAEDMAGLTAPSTAPEAAEDRPDATGRPRFVIVEGRVRSVQARPDRTYLDFGADYRSDFSVVIAAVDVADFSGPKAPQALQGARLRVRGYVRDAGGPMMRVDHPEQIEVLPGGDVSRR